MSAMTSQITSLEIVILTSGADQRKHQSSVSLASVREIHRWPMNSPHKGSVTRKMLPFDDVIMSWSRWEDSHQDRKSSTLAARKLVIFHRSFRHLNSRIPYEQSYCVRLIDNTGVSTTIRPDTQLLFATTVYVLDWSNKLIGTSQEICLRFAS